jgi:fibronectin-binding autotransporter adhesin
MSGIASGFIVRRGSGNARKSILVACGAVAGASLLSFVGSDAFAQTSYNWNSTASGNWSVASNWAGDTAPVVDPNGNANLEFSAAGAYTSNNDIAPFGVYDTTFDIGSGPVTLTGDDINLAWPLSETNNPAFADNSANTVTIDNNVNFESPSGVGGTTEYFVMSPGSTAVFNGTIGLTGGSAIQMTNGQSTSSTGGSGGTMIWTQPTVFSNSPSNSNSNYFSFRIYEGTFIMGGYTIDNGSSNVPIQNVSGVNIIQNVPADSNGAVSDLYIGPEDYEMGHPNDVVAFYLQLGGESMNQPVQIGDAGTTTIGGLNTSGTVYFNDFFKTLPTDGNGVVNGQSQVIYFSAAAGGTVVQNFALIRGGPSGYCGASVDKIGAGTWVVAGGGDSPTSTQAYQGNTTIRDGTLELAYDDTATNNVTLPPAVYNNPNTTYYANGGDGGSLGYNAATNAVQLGDSGTLTTDNIALLTLQNSGALGPRQVLHNISVNDFNPSGTTSIGVADNGIGNFSGNIALQKTVVLASGTGGTANFSGNITGTGGVAASGTGTVNLTGTNTYNGSTGVGAGAALVVGEAGALPSNTAVTNNGTLTINGNVTVANISGSGTLNIGVASPTALVIKTNSGASSEGALHIVGNSTLDITNNHLFITYGSGPDPISSIAALLKTGYNGGAWNGLGGIISSAAAANSGSYGLGYADFADQGNPAGLSSGQIEIKYTLLGDADLNGIVNGTDFAILAANFNKGVTGWDQGDFDYNNIVNGSDFADLAANFNKGASGADAVAALDTFAAANGLLADVPEPATLSLFCVAGMGLLHRRRRSLR